MTDFIRVSAIKKEDVLTAYEMLRERGRNYGLGPAPQDTDDTPPIYETCDRYISLNHVSTFYYTKEYGWIVKDYDNEYVVHADSTAIITELCKGVERGSDGLLISRVRQVIDKLDMLSEELKLIPRIGSAMVDLQHSFDQHKTCFSQK